ncbi:MAG: HEAT repeat domain-containing protein [Planctomycetes bacterium]|nr:HEAT repeat domain-containing protein [Planctomycetota bacterium]
MPARFLAPVVLLLGLSACASNSLESHPAYPEIQRQISSIVANVRYQTGTELVTSLKRLVAYDVFVVEQVADMASDPNPRLRSNAMWVLAQIRDGEHPGQMERIDDLLREGLDDPDATVAYEAATGLASRGEWDVLPRLIDGLNDADAGVRYRCHQQLVATTSRDFGYSIDGDPAVQQVAIAAWRDWYAAWSDSQG